MRRQPEFALGKIWQADDAGRCHRGAIARSRSLEQTARHQQRRARHFAPQIKERFHRLRHPLRFAQIPKHSEKKRAGLDPDALAVASGIRDRDRWRGQQTGAESPRLPPLARVLLPLRGSRVVHNDRARSLHDPPQHRILEIPRCRTPKNCAHARARAPTRDAIRRSCRRTRRRTAPHRAVPINNDAAPRRAAQSRRVRRSRAGKSPHGARCCRDGKGRHRTACRSAGRSPPRRVCVIRQAAPRNNLPRLSAQAAEANRTRPSRLLPLTE